MISNDPNQLEDELIAQIGSMADEPAPQPAEKHFPLLELRLCSWLMGRAMLHRMASSEGWDFPE